MDSHNHICSICGQTMSSLHHTCGKRQGENATDGPETISKKPKIIDQDNSSINETFSDLVSSTLQFVNMEGTHAQTMFETHSLSYRPTGPRIVSETSLTDIKTVFPGPTSDIMCAKMDDSCGHSVVESSILSDTRNASIAQLTEIKMVEPYPTSSEPRSLGRTGGYSGRKGIVDYEAKDNIVFTGLVDMTGSRSVIVPMSKVPGAPISPNNPGEDFEVSAGVMPQLETKSTEQSPAVSQVSADKQISGCPRVVLNTSTSESSFKEDSDAQNINKELPVSPSNSKMTIRGSEFNKTPVPDSSVAANPTESITQSASNVRGRSSDKTCSNINFRPFKCTKCDKAYTLQRSLNNHMKLHTKDKPYQCNYCEQQFTTLGNLDKHIVVHSASNPFKCGVCDKSFSQMRELSFHLKLHREGPPDTPIYTI